VAETLLIVGFLALACPVVWRLMWWGDYEGMRSSAEFRLDLKQRSPLGADEFYARFYADTNLPRDLVIRFRDFEAKFWRIDAGMVRPQHDYVRINGDLDSTDFIRAIEQEFAITLSDADCEKLDGSFDTLVRFIHTRSPMAA
jgi:hypothetical protein